jgi:hypothetical protein
VRLHCDKKTMMKILNGDFIAQLDEEMHFRRLWRQ